MTIQLSIIDHSQLSGLSYIRALRDMHHQLDPYYAYRQQFGASMLPPEIATRPVMHKLTAAFKIVKETVDAQG